MKGFVQKPVMSDGNTEGVWGSTSQVGFGEGMSPGSETERQKQGTTAGGPRLAQSRPDDGMESKGVGLMLSLRRGA